MDYEELESRCQMLEAENKKLKFGFADEIKKWMEETLTTEMYLRNVLTRIAKHYMTTKQLEKHAAKFGLSYEEHLEMAYENIQADAKFALQRTAKPKKAKSK